MTQTCAHPFDSTASTLQQLTAMGDRTTDRSDSPAPPDGRGAATALEPPFELSLPKSPPVPVLISVPHAGRAYSDDLRGRMRDPEFCAMRLEDRHVDALAREVAQATGAGLLVAHAPRALIDLNRASDDVDWDMVIGGAPRGQRRSFANRRSRAGLGLVPRRLHGMGEIWNRRLTRAELEERIAGVHQGYHRQLGLALETIRDRWGVALLIDLHSMPPLRRRVPHEAPAEFVIGDRFGASCDAALSARALAHLGSVGRVAAHNRPYAGGYILDRHGQPGRGIHALQVEVCRATYLDARLSEPSARMPAIARVLSGLVRDLAACTVTLGREPGFMLAAE